MQKEARAAQHQYGVQRGGIRCSWAPVGVGVGTDRPDRQGGQAVRRVAAAGIRFRIPLQHEVTTIP